MNKLKINIALLSSIIIFGMVFYPAFALNKKTTATSTPKVTTQKTVSDDYFTSLAKSTFISMFEKLIPKEKLEILLKFSDKLNYNPDKAGLQEIYLTSHTNGEDTFFSATKLSSNELSTKELKADTAEINSLTISRGFTSGDIQTNTFIIGTSQQPAGITIFDKTTKTPYCLFLDNGVFSSNSGAC